MKKFTFRLESLLRFKTRIEDQVESMQRHSLREKDEASRNTNQLTAKFSKSSQSLKLVKGTVTEISAIVSHSEHLSRIQQGIDESQLEERRRQKKVDQIDNVRRKVSAEVQSLDLLKQRLLTEHKRESNRKDQLRIDDHVVARWRQPANSAGGK